MGEDIVEELRGLVGRNISLTGPLYVRAAQEIERLRAIARERVTVADQLRLRERDHSMIAIIVTVVTGILEILDQLFGVQLGLPVEGIEILLAALTPLLVWLLPQIPWKKPA